MFVPKRHLEEVDFALDFMEFMLKKLKEYLDMDLQLPKLDGITINDLLLTGVENWGLIYFNPKNVLYKGNSSPGLRLNIARTITHQLVHNYFGNLVGISWWNSFWLTEGFASYFEYSFSNYYLEDFPMIDLFVSDLMRRNLVEHSLLMSVSLNKYIEHPEEVFSVFDFGMISRAASTIRMIEHFLGKDTFQKGLQKYLKEMQHLAAEAKDLYRNLQEAADEDHSLPEDIKVEDVLQSWIDQPGYPLLTVIRNYESNEIVVNQQRFLSSRGEVDTEGLSWCIPLSISTARNPNMNDTKPWVWLKEGTREVVLRTSDNLTWGSEDWVLFNVDQTGYYRVNYDTENWILLANHLHQGPPFAIGSINRAQIIDDSFNLAYSDVIPFPLALNIIKYVRFEPDYGVWVAANQHLLSLNRHLEGQSYELFFGRFLQHITEDLFEKLDVFENSNEKDTVKNTLLRPIIVDLACRSRSGKCLTATRIMVTAEALTGHVLAPQEEPSVYYCHGLKNADEKTFQFFWNKFKSLTNEQERAQIAKSISCYRNFDFVYDVLMELATDRFYSLFTVLERFQILITAVRHGNSKVALEFLKANHENISRTFSFNLRMEQTLRELAQNVLDEEVVLYQEVIDILFEAGHISSNQVRRYKLELEYQQTWIEENKLTIEDWIMEYFEPSQSKAANQITYLALIIFSVSVIILSR
ncbi:aminopeptidase N-like [Phlebotomus papatasi]|uniref:aminopeptidase N-like n=1 Tax=Phlebotomus papatasi TaxID=29031 RepID=UPI002483EDD4|nr:aminopeptidase N-like [Phlebotomus papatasi]